jgi:ATP-dependent protease ClpP protease subunit
MFRTGIQRAKIQDEAINSMSSEFYHNVETSAVHCYKNRNNIYFCDQINWNSVFVLNQTLRQLEEEILAEFDKNITELQKLRLKVEPAPILLHITTNGGLVHAAFSVVDVIKNLKVPVHTVIDGYVASSGTIISMAGAKRYICCNAYILIHEIRCGIWGKYDDVEVAKENAEKLQNHILKFYIKHKIKINEKELKDILKKDIDFCASEAITNGLADEIYKASKL